VLFRLSSHRLRGAVFHFKTSRGWKALGKGGAVTLSILDNVEHWRGRADAARLVANHLDDPVAKAAMLTIAEQYERIAEQAQVRSHDEAHKGSKGHEGSTAEKPPPGRARSRK
jgi:hypothetical protein